MCGKHGAHLKGTQKQCRISPLTWAKSSPIVGYSQMLFRTSLIRTCLGFPCYRWEMIMNVFHHINEDIKPSEQKRKVFRGEHSACMHAFIYYCMCISVYMNACVYISFAVVFKYLTVCMCINVCGCKYVTPGVEYDTEPEQPASMCVCDCSRGPVENWLWALT